MSEDSKRSGEMIPFTRTDAQMYRFYIKKTCQVLELLSVLDDLIISFGPVKAILFLQVSQVAFQTTTPGTGFSGGFIR